MKKIVSYMPVVLLFLYTALCFYRPPQIADGIIVCAIGALYGFMVHLRSKEVPEIKRTEEELRILNRIQELRLQHEVNRLEQDLNKTLAITEKGAPSGSKNPFVF